MSTNNRVSPQQSSQLQKIYQNYTTFMNDLLETQPRRKAKIRSLRQFEAWWEELDPETRVRCARDYRRGFRLAVEKSTARVRKLLHDYEAHATH